MKHHMNLIQMAQELQRQSNAKQDYLIDTRRTAVRYGDEKKAVLELHETDPQNCRGDRARHHSIPTGASAHLQHAHGARWR